MDKKLSIALRLLVATSEAKQLKSVWLKLMLRPRPFLMAFKR